jgi:hypothetical protein
MENLDIQMLTLFFLPLSSKIPSGTLPSGKFSLSSHSSTSSFMLLMLSDIPEKKVVIASICSFSFWRAWIEFFIIFRHVS